VHHFGGVPNPYYPLPRSVMTNQHLDRELIVLG